MTDFCQLSALKLNNEVDEVSHSLTVATKGRKTGENSLLEHIKKSKLIS